MKKEILISDDQPGIRLLLTDILKSEEYGITTATTGKETLEKLEEKQFELIILDYKLPIIDGIEILEKLSQWEMNIPVIVMSGLAEKIEKEVKDFPQVKKLLPKPFDIKELKESVKNLIDENSGLES